MLVDKIKEYQQKDFGINDTNKKQYGEVFTSFPLIIKILNQLPIEVWSDPSLTWSVSYTHLTLPTTPNV